MKKSKKFIKFKDYIIKLPNSQGLGGIRNEQSPTNDSGIPFVEPLVKQEEGENHSNESYGFNQF